MKMNSVKEPSKQMLILVPFCLLSPAFQAGYTKKHNDWNIEFLKFFSQSNINVIQMPCPEASFQGFKKGLSRKPHGLTYYQNLGGFDDYCDKLSKEVFSLVEELDKFIIVILGIEHSPTCAASYIYTEKGTQKRQGIFFQKLIEYLNTLDREITTIGINRRYPGKSLQRLEELYLQL